MTDFEVKFIMRSGLIRAMQVMNEAFDNVTFKKSSIDPVAIMQYRGAYELMVEFNKLLDEQYKELGG